MPPQDANPTPSFGGFGLTHGSAIPLIKPGSAVQTNETTSNLLRWERDQSYLMPPSMRDWLSEGHLAWFVVDAVGQMVVTSRQVV